MASQAAMTEAQLQTAVVRLCKLYGLHHHHQRYSIGSIAGWPDLFIVGRSAIARELKNDTNTPTQAQFDWGRWLDHAGIPWSVWRPADLRSGRIQKELEALK